MRTTDTRSRIGTALLAALGASSCAQVVGIDEFQVRSDLSPESSCTDPAGFHGRGCFSCPPQEVSQLRNACTDADCIPFDNARVPGLAAPSRPLTPSGSAPPSAPSANSGGDEPPADLPRCVDLTPRPVYLYGSSALTLGLRTLSQAIATEATLVYQYDTSCPGLDAILTGITRLKGTAQYWRPDRDQPDACRIEGDQLADIGLCDVAPESCVPNFAGSSSLIDDVGPVQVFMFTVPNGSSQQSISAEAAYAVYGYDDGGVVPWLDPASLVRRTPSSGVMLSIAASLGLAPDYWRGVIKQRSSELKPTLLAMPEPERALGITSADVAEEGDARANLRTLAYQHFGQSCAFTPDSSLGSSDKRNVRDGHYELWAPYHFYTRGQNGRTLDPFVAEIVGYLTGASPLPNRNTDFITTLKQAGLVPTCAMHVRRAKEGAPIEPFQPRPSCRCYFEASPPGGSLPDDCQPCQSSAQCPVSAPSCSFGYCEP
jgi:hypothetical protein